MGQIPRSIERISSLIWIGVLQSVAWRYGTLWNVTGALWSSYGTFRNRYGKYRFCPSL